MMEAVITGLCDEYKSLNKRKELFVALTCFLCFIPGIAHVTQVRRYLYSSTFLSPTFAEKQSNKASFGFSCVSNIARLVTRCDLVCAMLHEKSHCVSTPLSSEGFH